MEPKKQVLIYSMGSLDEDHGPVMSRQTDDIVAIKSSIIISARTGYSYRGHLPFSSDSMGEIARDWCPAWMDQDEVLAKLPEFIKQDLKSFPLIPSHIIILSGHGGNNFLKDQEARLTESLGIPVLYVPFYEEAFLDHPVHGRIEVEHATSGDHCISAYLGLVDLNKIKEVNSALETNPEKALEKWKVLGSLGWYVLYGGPRYEPLRNPDFGLVQQAKKFLEEKRIIADPEIGRILFNKNLDQVLRQVHEFTQSTPSREVE
jgi:creatinine amidohydrolase/Fe(II)-dependent formamide hydrolase-like protein